MKKQLRQRILALLLTVCMVLTMMPSMVFAAAPEDPTGDPVAEVPAETTSEAETAKQEEAPEAEGEVIESEVKEISGNVSGQSAMKLASEPSNDGIMLTSVKADGNTSGVSEGSELVTALGGESAAGNEGDVVTLKNDVELETYVTINGGNLTLDIGDHNITRTGGTGATVFYITSGILTIKGTTGTISTGKSAMNGQGIIVTGTGAKLVIEGGKYDVSTNSDDEENYGGIHVNNGAQFEMNGGSVTSENNAAVSVGADAKVNIGEDAKITSKSSFAIGTNGSVTGANITISGDAQITSDEQVGVYLPSGTMTVEGNASIRGTAGIVVRGGTLNVQGGTIEATGSEDVTVGAAGTAVPPAGIAVDKDERYNSGSNNVTVSGGMVKAAAGEPSISYTEEGVSENKKPDGNNKIEISGNGMFLSGDEGDTSVASYIKDNTDGTKGIDPDGNIAKRDGYFGDAYFLVESESGSNYYANFDDAAKAAGFGGTVYLCRSVTLSEPIKINTTITLALSDVHYDSNATIEAPGRVFEIGSEGKLTLRNVSIKSDDVLNSADVNNSAIMVEGTLIVNGNTSIEAHDTAIYVSGTGKLTVNNGYISSETEIAVSTNGSKTEDGAEINVNGGRIVGSDEACGIYAPKGKVTVKDGAWIEGGSGIVVRGGHLDVLGGVVESTSTKPVAVGDDERTMPAAAVVVDNNDRYDMSDGNKVNISGGTFEAKSGNNAVVHTKNAGVTEPNPVPTDVKVSGGTFRSGDKPDYSVFKYVNAVEDGIDSDGTVEAKGIVDEELFLIDYGYVADKSVFESAGDNWESPGGIVYKTSTAKWDDATFYWCFNRELTDKEYKDNGLTVQITCGNIMLEDTCNAAGPRFAASLKNSSQFADDLNGKPMSGGDYTISGSEFTVDPSIATTEVTLPESSLIGAPEVIAATLAGDAKATGVKASITKVGPDEKEYTVTVEAEDLHKHLNAEDKEGYWVGFAVKKPDEGSYQGFYYKFENDTEWQYSELETIDNINQTKGVAFYFAETDPTIVRLAWTTDALKTEDHPEASDIITFHVDFSKVEYHVDPPTEPDPTTPPTPPTPGGSTTPQPSTTVNKTNPVNGKFTVSNDSAKAGETVKVTPDADEGYVVDQVTVTDKSGKEVTVTKNEDGTYSFVMPETAAQPVTVNVTFKKEKEEGGEVTPPPIEEGTLVFTSDAQKRDIANRLTTSKDTSLKLKADAEGVTIGNLAEWDVTSDNPDVVEVLQPSHKLHYVGVGTANITVKATGSDGKVYSIVIPISVELGTPTFTLSHVSSKKARTFTVTTSTVRGADGFQVKYSLKKSLKSSKTKTYECGKKLNRQTIKANKSKRTYYVRVRAYIVDEDGNITTGAWSKLTKKITSR